MSTPDLLARLANHRTLGFISATEREWLARHGTMKTFAVGDVLTRKGEVPDAMSVVFSGRLVIRVDRGAGSHKLFEWLGGDIGGYLPFSRRPMAPADVVAEEPTELLLIPMGNLPELIRECPAVTAAAVWAMLDRTRQFTSGDLRDEKLLSLGRLAAGLAHELNNPASAAARSAKLLTEALDATEATARRLGEAHLSAGQLTAIDTVRDRCRARAAHAGSSAVARADREDALALWLAGHGVSEACAAPLAETAITLEELDTLAVSVHGDALDIALQWVAAGCVVRSLASEIGTSASRMFDLVDAVKGFTFMDRAPTPQPVDIRRGIEDTLTMLGAKTRAKSARVSLQFAPDLPLAHAVGAELNQVWMNLIDNALDAIAEGGHVVVTAGAEAGRVVVRVGDDGPGIPAELRERIFEPFFTTKGVGRGTGLGLDVVRRLVQRHEGEIEVESRSGRTEFKVRLPAAT
jgi:signal transduction histidine kinase